MRILLLNLNPALVYSKDSDSQSSTTKSGKLENRFNKDDVQKELDFQREVTEKFGPNVAEAGSLLANKFGEEAKAKRNEAAIALEEAEKAKAENNNETNRALVKQARDNFETASREAKEWETGGSQRLVIDSALNVISTALAGRPAAEVVASGLSPAVNNQIKKATTDAKGNVNTALNLTAHALWGAIEAYAGNRNVAAGAAGAAGGEVADNFLASTLYDKSPENLSEEEKRTVSSLSQVAAGIAGGSLSDSSDGAIIAAKTAKDSVENNSLTQGDIHSAYQRLLNGEDIEVVLRDLEHLSQKERDKLLADCDAACRQVVPSLLMAANDCSEEQVIAIGSILSKIPAEQRSRVDMLVQSENSKTLEAIENSKSDVEKHIALAVKVMRFFQAENAVSGGKPSKPKIAMSSYGYKGNNLIGNSYGKLGTVIDKPDINIAGLRKHYVDRKIQREVKTDDVFSTLDNPSVVLRQSNGGYLFLSEKAAVVVNSKGELVTTYGQNYFDNNIQSILRETKNGNK